MTRTQIVTRGLFVLLALALAYWLYLSPATWNPAPDKAVVKLYLGISMKSTWDRDLPVVTVLGDGQVIYMQREGPLQRVVTGRLTEEQVRDMVRRLDTVGRWLEPRYHEEGLMDGSEQTIEWATGESKGRVSVYGRSGTRALWLMHSVETTAREALGDAPPLYVPDEARLTVEEVSGDYPLSFQPWPADLPPLRPGHQLLQGDTARSVITAMGVHQNYYQDRGAYYRVTVTPHIPGLPQ